MSTCFLVRSKYNAYMQLQSQASRMITSFILKSHFEFLRNCENESFNWFVDQFTDMFLTDLDDTLYPMSSGLNLACRKNIEGMTENS
jgi:hypothetical protein